MMPGSITSAAEVTHISKNGFWILLGDEELLVLSEGGVLIRTRVGEVSRYGRSSQGVTIMRLGEGDRVVSVMIMLADETLEEAADKGDEALLA